MATVYSYRRLNFRTDAVSIEPGKATAQAVARMIGCSIIPGSAEDVPADELDPEGIHRGRSVEFHSPQPRERGRLTKVPGIVVRRQLQW